MLQLGNTWVSIWSIKEDKGTFALISMSSSRKDNRDGGYLNSSWGDFNSFVGDAYKKVPELIERLEAAQVGKSTKQPVRVQLISGGVKRESFEQGGKTKYGAREQIVIFDFKFDDRDAQPSSPTPPADDEIPF